MPGAGPRHRRKAVARAGIAVHFSAARQGVWRRSCLERTAEGLGPVTYVVTENCIRCKYMDCVEVCPVDCFYVGENMLVIHPDECIDCGVCEPECPAEAIFPDSDDRAAEWAELNRTYAQQWPNITRKGEAPADAEEWNGKPDKKELFDPKPGAA